MTGAPEVTWREALASASMVLESPVEARWLVEEVAGLGPAVLALTLEYPAEPAAVRRLERLVERRLAGEPFQHVLGHWPFRTVELTVDGRALVPRPETEVVTGLALVELARRRCERAQGGAGSSVGGAQEGRRGTGSDDLLVIDLGTGSGAIACALAAEAPDVRVLAVDRSDRALELAAVNRARLAPSEAERIEIVRGNWYCEVDPSLFGEVDCIVANPPYIAEDEWPLLDPVVREHDPYEALVSGPSGLEAIRDIVIGAPAVLAPGGALVLEIASGQGEPARELATRAGAQLIEVVPDLAGRDRVLIARWDPPDGSSASSP